MIWRKFKLDWSYAIGELLIVVVGVLIALAIDQLERSLEQGLSEERLRLIVDDVLKSRINRHVTAEINLARFIRGITLDSRKQALKLLDRSMDRDCLDRFASSRPNGLKREMHNGGPIHLVYAVR